MTQPKKPKVPKKVTAQSLRNAALFYLERFATSRVNLFRVLERRAFKSHTHHGTDMEEARGWIESLLDELENKGFLNDRAYAEGRALALQRRGTAPRMIAMKLREKGLSNAHIEQALETLSAENGPDLERISAIRLAKRRRLGPWRSPEKREAFREKDMAALARAGFSYDLAREIIETTSIDLLEEEL